MCQLAFIVSVSRVQLQVPLDQQFAQAPGGLARFLNLTKMGLGASKHPLTYILALLPEEVKKNTQNEKPSSFSNQTASDN